MNFGCLKDHIFTLKILLVGSGLWAAFVVLAANQRLGPKSEVRLGPRNFKIVLQLPCWISMKSDKVLGTFIKQSFKN